MASVEPAVGLEPLGGQHAGTATPLPSPGIAIDFCGDAKPDPTNTTDESSASAAAHRPIPLSLGAPLGLSRNLTSPVASSNWKSPARHHRRTPSQHREIKETIDAHSEYTNDDADGRSQHRINQYRVIEEIGRGSYSSVHLAKDQFGNEYAMKEFSKSRLRRRAQSLILRRPPNHRGPLRRAVTTYEEKKDALFLIRQEIAIMKKLHHDNLVQLIEVLDDPEEDSLWMVLELCEKGAVMDITVGQTVPSLEEEKARCCFRDLILGIEYLHAQGVCHRDLKPDNLLMTKDDVLKIVDFGVSDMFEKPEDGRMMTSKAAGTPAFMPPELCGKHEAVSGTAADVWSMGICLYCFRYGKVPYDQDNVLDMYEAIARDNVVIPADEDPVFADLMKKILEKDPDKRISMRDLREHPWVTKGGEDPLLPAEENCSDLIEDPNPLEVNHAFTRKISHIVTVVKAINKFLALRDKNRATKRNSSYRDSCPKRQDSTVEEAEALVNARQYFLEAKLNKSTDSNDSTDSTGRPFLGIGIGSLDEFSLGEPPVDVVSDSPIGVDFNIYDRAFGAEVDQIRSSQRGQEKKLYLTKYVRERDQFKADNKVVDARSSTAGTPNKGVGA